MKMAIEEMAELQKEICKWWRRYDNADDIAEEIADVEIMLEQLRMIFGPHGEVDECKEEKLERLEARLKMLEMME